MEEKSRSTFKVDAKRRVKTALTVQEAKGLSQTPFKPQKGVMIKSAATGKTNVPKKEVIRERAGRSSAVK